MSGFYLEGPAPPAKSGTGEGGGGGNWNLPPARYALPLGEIVVGRDSVRDASPANCNKLRIGIDKREEVCPLEGRLQVTHKQGAINGIRIIRWKGSPGLTSAQRAELRIGAPGAARSLRAGEMLQGGQQSFLYPGDTLQLDGFRVPSSSNCSFLLHPLPAGWSAPPARSGSINSQSGAASPRSTTTTAPTSVSKKAGGASSAGVARDNSRAAAAKEARGVSNTQGKKNNKKGSPTPVARRAATAATTSKSGAAATAASSRAGGAPSTPTPSPLLQQQPPPPPRPRAGSAGKPRAAAASGGGGGGGGGKSPAVSSAPSAVRVPLAAGAAGGRARGASSLPSSPGVVDEATVKKKLAMSVSAAHRSGSTGGGASTRGSTARVVTPLSTAGRLLDSHTSPAKTPPPSSGVKTKRPHAAATAVAAVPPPPRGEAGSHTPTRSPGRVDEVSNASAGSSKRLKRCGGADGGVSGGTSASSAVGRRTGGGGSGGEGSGGSSSAAAACPAATVAQIKSEPTAPAAAAAAAAAAPPAAEAAPPQDASTPATAAPESPRPDAPQVDITPRDRASQARSAQGSGAGGGAVGGDSWSKGDLVVLKARTSKGMNKLGGVARVLEVFEDGTYFVKLSLGGKPTRVGSDLLFSYTPSPEPAFRGRRRSTASRRRDTAEGGPREVDPSNGWVPSSPSSCSSSPSPKRTRSKDGSGRSVSSGGGGGGGGGTASSGSPSPRRSLLRRGVKKNSGDGTAAANPPAAAGATTGAKDDNDDDGNTAATTAAARPGDRARVLYDNTDWYMATVVGVHRGSSVTVRFDDGSKARVTLSPGDAEICADDALAPAASEPPAPASSSSRGGGGGGGGGGRRRPGSGVAVKGVRALGAGGRVLGEGEGKALTEERAKALLDTAPQKLVGLVYQEHHRGYGGWWETVVTEVSEERMGDSGGAGRDKDGGGNAMWPESVVVGQMDRSGEKVKAKAGSAAASSGEGGGGDDDEPDFVYTRKTRSLLSRLRTWDKHREAEWEATALEADDEAAAAAEPKVAG
ncbi:unnamed protein product [Ectocarpus sp. CCAP 1310/34]|nr:unnamed protein product [Ectocarpus sp. CCAP 1310/34]